MRLTTKGLINDVKTDGIPYLERYKKLSQLEDLMEKFGIEEVFQLENKLCAVEVLNDLGKKTNSHCMSDFINFVERVVEIENILGVKLEILFNALLKDGIFVKWNDKHIVHLDANLLWLRTDVKPYVIDFKQSDQPHYLKDYGKTWALTKEELL